MTQAIDNELISVPDLVDDITSTTNQLRSSMAGYATLKRLVDEAEQAVDDNAAGKQTGTVNAPILNWPANLNGEPVEVATDLALLSPEDRKTALVPLVNVHAAQMQEAAEKLSSLSATLAHILKP